MIFIIYTSPPNRIWYKASTCYSICVCLSETYHRSFSTRGLSLPWHVIQLNYCKPVSDQIITYKQGNIPVWLLKQYSLHRSWDSLCWKGSGKDKSQKALLLKSYTPRISQEPPNAYDKITAAMDSTGFHNFVSMERSLVLSTKRTGRSSHLLFEAGFLWQQMVLLAPPLQCWPLLLLTHLQRSRTKSANPHKKTSKFTLPHDEHFLFQRKYHHLTKTPHLTRKLTTTDSGSWNISH